MDELFVYDPETKSHIPESQAKRNRKQRYIRMPLAWAERAADLPGKSLHVAAALWYRAGRQKADTVRFTKTIAENFGVDSQQRYRALKYLEQEGLISVERQKGKNPVVTLLEIETC